MKAILFSRLPMLAFPLKIAGVALIGWLGFVSVWPAASEAWKVRQAAVEVASRSAGLNHTEVSKNYLEAMTRRGVKNVTMADIDATKDGERWIVGANYEVAKKLFGAISVVYEFSIASDRKSFWENTR
jgi:hypothetical protein